MTRLINKEKQQSVNQTSSGFIHYILLVIIIMEFIPLPDVGFTKFGRPSYLVAELSAIVIAFNFKRMPNISPIVLKIILLLLFYSVYDYALALGLDILDEKVSDNYPPFQAIRKCIELLVFSIACTNLAELKRVLFTISTAIVISAVFGLLVHHFGEPFQGIRDWLLQSRMTILLALNAGADALPGKGVRLIGLSGTHWLFGCLMSAGPAIALICGRLSPFKWLWAIIFLLLLYSLYLNGERAALLGACFSVVSLLIIWRLISIPYICIGLTLVLSVYIFTPSSTAVTQVDPDANLTSRLTSSSGKKDLELRIKLWTAAIVSVIEHPLTGPKHKEYVGEVFGQEHLIVVNSPDRKIVIAHNAYLYPGISIGIMGWFIVLFYLAMLKNILTQVFTAATNEKQEKIIFEGVPIVVLAPMINSIFQNEGIFSHEPTAICLNGLLISSYQILYNRNRCQTSKPRS